MAIRAENARFTETIKELAVELNPGAGKTALGLSSGPGRMAGSPPHQWPGAPAQARGPPAAPDAHAKRSLPGTSAAAFIGVRCLASTQVFFCGTPICTWPNRRWLSLRRPMGGGTSTLPSTRGWRSWGWHLATNHPLTDGNKRMAFLAMVEFVERTGFEWVPPRG
jgi:hypothetical protein